ncbi:MAG: cupin domain-containing protein [Proteobacteria bacterium]|nr:cupin domain-containing protein [Pseudomonadota bacterium]
MYFAKLSRKIGVIAAIALGAFAVSGLEAAAQSEYKPKAEVETLFDGPLVTVPGMQLVIKHFAVPPGFVGGKHFHPGQVFVYVLEGGFAVEMGEDAPLILKPGELFQEPLGGVMRGKNLSADDWAKFVVFQIGEAGKPMMVKAE